MILKKIIVEIAFFIFGVCFAGAILWGSIKLWIILDKSR